MPLYLLLFFLMIDVHAHQASLTPEGRELFWANPSVPVSVYTNTSDMTPSQVSTEITKSINQWNASSTAKVNIVGNSVNEIRFVSNFPYGSAVIGVTEISYNPSGAIQKASILLNDDFYFRPTEGIHPSVNGKISPYLGDVVTHELGHLFGLSHSEVLNASMFYSSFSGQSTVAFDDRSGIRQKYSSGYGTIRGVVQGGSSIGVLGVHVQAISRRSGEASSAITDEKGNFTLGGLDLNDTYYLYTSPTKNPESLPGYFANVQNQFCPATYVGSFFSACGRENDGRPWGITLTPTNPELNVGVVTINCNLKTDPEYDYQKLQDNFEPVMMSDFRDHQKYEKSFVGWFRQPSTTTWSKEDILQVDLTSFTGLTGYQKYFKVSLVSYPFGNPLEYEMSLYHYGSLVATRSLSYSFLTRTYQPDFSILVPLSFDPKENYFEMRIRSKKLGSSALSQTFPSFEQFTSNTQYPYLVITSIWQDTLSGNEPLIDNEVFWSDNRSCLDAPFTFAVGKTKSKIDAPSAATEGAVAGAACGTIEPPSSGGPGSSLLLLCLGFMLSLLTTVISKTSKKFLS